MFTVFFSCLCLSQDSDYSLAQTNLSKVDFVENSSDQYMQFQAPQSVSSYKLNAVTTIGEIQSLTQKKYQSSAVVSSQVIANNPSGNGDITSILKVLPNVQFDTSQNRSTAPGEIDPANVSISGGLFYQNNFQLDGFNMNNDIDPIGGTTPGSGGASQGIRGSRSQGFNVDTSLLESIVVQDSNISASYGGFSGGVIEANIRKPRKGFHTNISYQYTSDKLTQYYIHDSAEASFATSSDENYQPNFSKHLIKSSVEGRITQNLGILGSYTTTRSYIPLNSYSRTFSNGIDVNDKRTQSRVSDNYYVKATYNPIENLNLEANLGFIPQDNTYYINIAKDSSYTMKGGGIQSGLKVLLDTKFGLWTNTIGYSRLENSRRGEKNYYLTWQQNETNKNWARTSAFSVIEGSVSSIDQIQDSFNLKSDMKLESYDIHITIHLVSVGLELGYQHVNREVIQDYYYTTQGTLNNIGLLSQGQTCSGDIFGLNLCHLGKLTNTNTPSGGNSLKSKDIGQFAKQLNVIPRGGVSLNNISYGVYIEDDISIDLSNWGEMNARLGFRLDGDSYMDKITLAPRFSLNYVAPYGISNEDYKSTFIFGVNRYYGRNLFSYRLYDSIIAATKRYTRADINSNWVESNVSQNSNFRFNKLNIPYSDEITLGINQNLWLLNLTLKYIHREGKDEIVRRQRRTASGNAQQLPGYSSNYTFYTNEGGSKSDVISFLLSNKDIIETFSVRHYYLLAIDYTNTRRSYNIFVSDDAYIDNEEVLYDGKVIRYQDRPTENFNFPYTLRLNTTHMYNVWKAKLIWNNFFRIRGGYERMVLLNKNSPGFNPNFNGNQYGKMRFGAAFNWDIRLGFEMNVYKGNTLYMNLDIINVLNTKNIATLSLASGAAVSGIASSMAVPVYEVGRQFWLQVGYRYR
ncbi:TonB-dependent receptor [Helicobacter muridarum]|uniref:Plug domain-containing protein n=1 Tax=Helicobacter muridarum TaxID=216 RepID=UPI00068C92F3|nr:Plug domain-containing protein [Helicobacter muridarum]